MQGIEVREICKKCGMVNNIGPDRLYKGFFRDIVGKRYYVVYYVCLCGKINVVQIDSNSTKKDSDELKELIVKAYARGHLRGEAVPKKWVDKKDRITGRLLRKRADLLKKMQGKTLLSEDKKNEIIV